MIYDPYTGASIAGQVLGIERGLDPISAYRVFGGVRVDRSTTPYVSGICFFTSPRSPRL